MLNPYFAFNLVASLHLNLFQYSAAQRSNFLPGYNGREQENITAYIEKKLAVFFTGYCYGNTLSSEFIVTVRISLVLALNRSE